MRISGSDGSVNRQKPSVVRLSEPCTNYVDGLHCHFCLREDVSGFEKRLAAGRKTTGQLDRLVRLDRTGGLEPPTNRLVIGCSIQLSYALTGRGEDRVGNVAPHSGTKSVLCYTVSDINVGVNSVFLVQQSITRITKTLSTAT